MELFTAIALLCQVTAHSMNGPSPQQALDCQQYYTHCMNTKPNMTQPEAMTKCIMERKL